MAISHNTGNEVRQSDGDWSIAGALAANSGMPQGMYAPLAVDGRNQAIGENVHHTLRVGRDSGDAVAAGSSEVAGTLRFNQGTLPAPAKRPLKPENDPVVSETVVSLGPAIESAIARIRGRLTA